MRVKEWLQAISIWPRSYCPYCRCTVWMGIPWYDKWLERWRAKCRKCYSMLPVLKGAAIKIGSSGIHSKRFYEKHKGSVPDKIKERHMDDSKKAPWRKLANMGGRIGFKGNGKQVS